MSDVFANARETVARELSVVGQSILITGGGAGLGRAVGRMLASRTARVALVDVRADRIEEAVAEARSSGGEVVGVVADVARPDEIQRAIDVTVQAFGRLDVMVNGASIIKIVPFLEIDEDLWRSILDVNATGVFFGTQLAAKQMIKQVGQRQPGQVIGRIVNITSPSSTANSDTQTIYSASKAAVDRVTGGAALALYQPYGICVCALKPIAMPTPMWEGIGERREELAGKPRGGPAIERARELVFGRFQPIEAHAEVLAWLIAANPDIVNGKVISTTPYLERL